MAISNSLLPEFGAPPVTEVALGVQFEQVDLLPAHLGLWALKMRKLGYTVFEQHPPLDPVFEKFGKGSGAQELKFDFGPPPIRSWFLQPDNSRLIQLQPDRFIHNWRKAGMDSEYPRYDTIRREFEDRWNEFVNFFLSESGSQIAPNQVEVTYVNLISVEAGSDLSSALGLAGSQFTDGFLPAAENSQLSSTFVMPDIEQAVGRLRVSAQTAIDAKTKKPICILKLTARGAPLSSDADGILQFMDVGREWIVRGFADVTTSEMHKNWKRER